MHISFISKKTTLPYFTAIIILLLQKTNQTGIIIKIAPELATTIKTILKL